MQCEHAHELISDYVAGHLDRALIVTIDNHLGECAACREDVAGLRRVWANLDTMAVVEPPPFFHANLMHRLNAELTSQEEIAAQRRAIWDWRALFRPRVLAAAATAFIVIFAGTGLLRTQSAELWPFGILSGPAAVTRATLPPLQKPAVEWTADAPPGAGGVLAVHLQLDGALPTGTSEITCTVSVENDPSGSKSVSGVFLPNGKVTVRMPLPSRPDVDKDTLVITVKSGKDGTAQSHVWRGPLPLQN